MISHFRDQFSSKFAIAPASASCFPFCFLFFQEGNPSLVSLIPSCSLADLSQDSTKSFDVEIMQRQKPSGLFSSCLITRSEPPCKVTTVFSSTSLANTVDLEGKYLTNLKADYNDSAV